MAVDSISTCKPAQWQKQHSSGYVEDLTKKHSETESLSANDRLTQDSMTRARIHRNTSQSAFYAVAAHYFGVDFVGCELDKDYFEAAKARFDMATKQLAMSI
jgi:hypothetical protein